MIDTTAKTVKLFDSTEALDAVLLCEESTQMGDAGFDGAFFKGRGKIDVSSEQPCSAGESLLERVCAFPHSIDSRVRDGLCAKYILESRVIPSDLVPQLQAFITSRNAQLPVHLLQTNNPPAKAMYDALVKELKGAPHVWQELDHTGVIIPEFWVAGIVPQVVLTHAAQAQILISDIDNHGLFKDLYGHAAANVALGEVARVVQEEIAREYKKDGWRALRTKESGMHYWIPDSSLLTSRAGSGDDMCGLTIGLGSRRQKAIRDRIASRVNTILVSTHEGEQRVTVTTVIVPYDKSKTVFHNMGEAHAAMRDEKEFNKKTGRSVMYFPRGYKAAS